MRNRRKDRFIQTVIEREHAAVERFVRIMRLGFDIAGRRTTGQANERGAGQSQHDASKFACHPWTLQITIFEFVAHVRC